MSSRHSDGVRSVIKEVQRGSRVKCERSGIPLSRDHSAETFSKFDTKLSKRSLSYLSNPESSSIAFDRNGQRLLRHSPVQP